MVMMLLKCCWWVLTATWPGQLHHASKSHAATLTNKRRRGRQIAGDLLARVAKQLKTVTGSLNQKVEKKVRIKCSMTLYFDELIQECSLKSELTVSLVCFYLLVGTNNSEDE